MSAEQDRLLAVFSAWCADIDGEPPSMIVLEATYALMVIPTAEAT